MRPMIGVSARLSLGKEASTVENLLNTGNLLPHGATYKVDGIYAQR
jgi:hypothetical protein